MSIADVAFGGNVGEVLSSFRIALSTLKAWGYEPLTRGISPAYRNHAWVLEGAPPQPDHWNAVVRFETSVSALTLLDDLQKIELMRGRRRCERWAARTLDLDLLRFGDETFSGARLTVPHPGLWNRPFFFWPLAQVDDMVMDKVDVLRVCGLKERRDRWWPQAVLF